MNNQYYSTCKDNYLPVLLILEELIINNCWCKFDPDCEVLENNNISKMNISTNKKELVNMVHRLTHKTLILIIIIQLSETMIGLV